MSGQMISYVVGEEKRLADILGPTEILPLLEGAVRAGAAEAELTDGDGEVLWSCGGKITESCAALLPVVLEGETVGRLVVRGSKEREELLGGLVRLLADTVNMLINNNLKRMLTTEIHTSVVKQSYDELMEINRKLVLSEGKYRELSLTLEKKVEERTEELRLAHARLLQQEKMASIGQLAAGVAHEINNPLGFITSNLATLQKYVGRFILMLDCYRSATGSDSLPAEIRERVEGKWRELRLDSICADVGDLLAQSLEGAERVRKIVADLKGFSHVDDSAEAMVDINGEIDRTLSVLHNQIPHDASIDRGYQPLPPFFCNGSLLCQVFYNIIQNAIQAQPKQLHLQIGTVCDGAAITVTFRDNGPGIPEAVASKIFEPFFTTREVGAGTGMGLAVAYDVVARYGGTISAGSHPSGGAVISVALPLKGR